MKYCIFFILSFFSFTGLFCQNSSNYKIIDSIHGILNSSSSIDSVSIAKNHYQIAEQYRYSLKSDSAYYYYNKAGNFFKKLKKDYELSRTLYGIAAIQSNEKDYTGSEVTSFEGIALLEDLEQVNNVRRYKSYFYNLLGVVFDELGQYEQSIKYYKESLELKRGLDGNFDRSIGLTLNNLIKVYRRSGKYSFATQIYNEIIDFKELVDQHPDIHVLALGNYARTLYVSGNEEELPELYLEALKIADSIGDSYNSIIVHQHLAEYYKGFENSDSAKFHAYKARDISEAYYNDDLLKSLLILSNVEEGDIAVKHLKDYIKLNDSLIKNERAVRNKFARIRYETSKIEQENIKITRERMWLLIISAVLIMASVLLYIVITQRNKNKELKFIQQQQETNEEIYNLMLSQQDNIEEARVLEKKRISEELHDGVLGRLFGTRLSLDSLNMGTTKEAILTRSQYINELKTIEEDIRKVSHELNTDFVSGSGFADIITGLVESQTLAYQLKYDLTIGEAINWDNISNKDKIHMYRILQEALHNIYKHANASKVEISFKLKKSVICLEINDDGSGFDVAKAKSGIGLKNMNSRIKEINGIINIESQIEQGTTVTIEVPIE